MSVGPKDDSPEGKKHEVASFVIPAKAGIRFGKTIMGTLTMVIQTFWIPTFAGMTR